MDQTPLSQIFDQCFLSQLQERQQHIKKAEVGSLFDKYKSVQGTSKASQQKMLAQIMLALPLWLMTLPKPANQLDYIKCLTEIDEDLQLLLQRVQRSFDLA